jgi:hypothetical protein
VCVCGVFFFIYSSVVGQLGCFHLLAIVNNTALKIEMQDLFATAISLP